MALNGTKNQRFLLGIDLGTTTVKVALLDTATKEVIRTKSRETQASVYSDIGSSGSEQDPDRILTALQFCVSGLPKDELLRVEKIGVAGQMHGVLLWKWREAWTRNHHGRFVVNSAACSNLFTWQDGRCGSDFLSTLPSPCSHLKLSSGHGCATLFWLKRHRPEWLAKFDCAGTVQDFVVAMLCDLESPVMSVHNAASWGYFDTRQSSWNIDM